MGSGLVVDDSALTRKFVRDALEGGGHSTAAEASSVEECAPAAGAYTPDLLTLGPCLPDGDAIEAWRRLTEGSPETHVVEYATFADRAAE